MSRRQKDRASLTKSKRLPWYKSRAVVAAMSVLSTFGATAVPGIAKGLSHPCPSNIAVTASPGADEHIVYDSNGCVTEIITTRP